MPIVIGWFLAVRPVLEFPEYTLQRVQYFSPWIGLSLLALAATVVIFIRLRERRLRGATLLVSGLLTLSMVFYCTNGRLGLPTLLLLVLLMVSLMLGPVLLERKLRHGKRLARV